MISKSHQPCEDAAHHIPAGDETAADYCLADDTYALDFERYQSTGLPTSASGIATQYPRTLSKHLDILAEVMARLSSIPHNHVRNMTSQLLFAFQRILTIHQNTTETHTYFPPLRFRLLDDGSVLIEWIFRDFRIGFSIEPTPGESGWYLVSNQNLEEVSKSGPLKTEEMDPLLSFLLSFVVAVT